MNCKYMNMLRVVRGNAFKLKIAVEAYTPSGRRIDSFALGEDVLKLDKNGTLTTKDYTILEGTTILVAFDGSESLGVYGFQMSGEYEGEAWRWANAEIFQIVETNAKANIPDGCVLLDDTYNMAMKIVLSGGDGVTFTPSVSEQGIISWTNDGGLPNPEPRNIRGPQGERGPQGIQGPRGPVGLRGQIGPKGDKGDKGDTGATPVLDVTASVDENVGNPMVVVESFGPAEHRTFDFQFKNLKGQKGETGATGPQGPQGQQGEPGNYTKPASGIPLSDLNGNVASGIVYDVTANNSGATFASLSALLSSGSLSTLIPTDVRKGGMQIRFVQSSDNKYVQYRLLKNTWSADANDWQSMNVDDLPTDYSQNLVKSGGVKNMLNVSNLSKNKMLAISGLGIRNWNPAVITSVSGETLYYFPVTSGQLVYIEIEGSATRFECAFTAQKPASGNSVSDYKYAYAPMTKFTAPSDGYVCISSGSVTDAICYSKKNDIGSNVFDIQNELNGVLYNGFVLGNVLLFDKTQVYEGDTIVFKTDKTYSGGEVVFYDEDDTILLEVSFSSSSTQERMIPKGFDHCSTLYTPYFESLLIKKASMEERIRKNEVEQTPLRGLKIAYNGDSICESRTDQASSTYNGGAYAKLIADLVGGTYQNRGVSGGILASAAPDPSQTPTRTICTDVTNMASDADLVCFEGGINDYWLHVPLGDYQPNKYDETGGAFDTTTLCGALESIFYQATSKWVGKPIVFIIVHKVGSTAYTKNYTGGYTFQEAHDKMVEICEKWAIPFYDAFSKSGLNGNINAQNSEFFIINASTQTGDRTHPNIDGYKNYYVKQLVSLFSSILPTE